MQIRAFQERDRPTVRAICKATAIAKYVKDEESREEMCFLFLDYFLDCEPEHAFVAVNEENELVGYICGSVNYPLFKEKMRSVYDKKIKKVSLIHCFFSRSVTLMGKKLFSRYGCCVHMNVSPSFQHRGIGFLLLDFFRQDCGSKGLKSIFVVVKNRKTGGYPFFIRNGFRECERLPFGSLALVCPLPAESAKQREFC